MVVCVCVSVGEQVTLLLAEVNCTNIFQPQDPTLSPFLQLYLLKSHSSKRRPPAVPGSLTVGFDLCSNDLRGLYTFELFANI